MQWVQEACTLVFAALLIPFGTLAERAIAILGAILFESLSRFLDSAFEALSGIDVAATATAVVASAGAAIPGLLEDPATAEAARLAGEAFTQATSFTAYVGAAFLGIAFIASLSGLAGTRTPHRTLPQ